MVERGSPKDLLDYCQRVADTYVDKGFKSVEVSAEYVVSTEVNIDYHEAVIVPRVSVKFNDRSIT